MTPPPTGFIDLIVGSLMAFVGLVTLGGSLLRQRRADPLLAAFGAFALLWGVRQFFSSELIGWVGFGELATAWVTNTITYLIIVPAWIFFWRLLGPGWRGILAKWLGLAIAFATIGIGSDLVQRTPGTLARHPNNIMILIGLLIAVASLLQYRGRMTLDLRVLSFGLLVFGGFAANNNLVSLGLLPWSWSEESFGFVIWVACLGFIAARKSVATERQLASLENELAMARKIQLSLLPGRLPETDDLRVAVRFRPTSAVAGDLYDFLSPTSGGIGLFLADVSGHGVPAALIASMVKVAAASRLDCADRPAELLAQLNRTFCGNIQRGFVTAVYVFLDTGSGEIAAAVAGHPRPFLSRAGEPPREVGGSGPILGRFESASYREQRLELAPGDRLVLYTDGLVEARDGAGNQFGEDRLRTLLAANRSLVAEDLCDALLEDLGRWTGKKRKLALEDDLTLVVADLALNRPMG